MTLQLNDLLDWETENGSSIRGAIPSSRGAEVLYSQALWLEVQREEVYSLMRPWTDFELQTDLQNTLSDKHLDKVHINTLVAIKWAKDISWDSATHVHIFTDGSHMDREALKEYLEEEEMIDEAAAWAFVVVIEQVTIEGYVEHGLLGFTGDQVSVGQHQKWIGIADAQSLAAECAGIIWGTLWWLQSGLHEQGLAATLWVDCTAAGLVSCGGATLHDYPEMHSVARSVVQLAQCVSLFSVQHCRGHSGQPWNEFADIVAKDHASLGLSLGYTLPPNPLKDFEFQHMKLEWAWMYLCDQQYSVALPKIQPSGQIEITHHDYDIEAMIHNFDSGQKSLTTAGADKVHMVMRWRVYSNNVLTLRENEGKKAQDGMLIAGRTQAIQKQLEEQGVLLFGAQEARSSRGSTCGEDWGRIRSGCTAKAGLGCELWYGRYIPYAEVKTGSRTKEVFFKKEDFTVMHHDERRLLVAVRTPYLHIDVYVGHSPHSGNSAACLDEWWKQTMHVLRQRRHAGTDVLFLFDVNGKIGSSTSPAVGDCCANEETRNGWHFHCMLQEFRAFAPSTFHDMQKTTRAEAGTWTDKKGDKHRIDFVGLPASWKKGELQAWVDQELELLHKAEDHRPACVDMVLHFENERLQEGCQWRTTDKVDRTKLKSEEMRTLIAERIRMEPQVPWHVNVHAHGQHLTERLREIIEEECPKQRNDKRKEFITEETWERIKQRKGVRKQIHWSSQELRRVKLSSGLSRWKKRIFPYLRAAGEQRRREAEAKSLHFTRAWWARYLSISRNTVVRMLKKD